MKDTESISLTKQIKRYAQVGGVVGKLATKLASQKYLGIKLDKNKHAAEIRAALGGIKGPLMKVAQLSATIPDLLPPEYVEELMHLQSNAPPMGWLFVKRRMAAELSSDWQKSFIDFDKEATRAASLGQVHKAVLPNKKVVACKLQYPDMESAVTADLVQLKMIFSIYQSYNKAIKTDEIYKEITERLKEELDYVRENKLMNVFNNIFSDSKFSKHNIKERFEIIYNENYWESKESRSGIGSEIKNTKTLLQGLENVIEKFNIKSIIDIPCGDFNWMRKLNMKNISYSGLDIVQKSIDENNKKYKKTNVNFYFSDITSSELPKGDLMLSLIHI